MRDVILWDWDNTLADTFGAILAAQNDMRAAFGLSPWTEVEAKEAMNASGRDLLTHLFGADNRAKAEALYLTAYQKYATRVVLKPGAKAVLEKAKKLGYTNILASNKEGSLLRQEATACSLTPLFDRIVGAGEAAADKPAAAFMETVLNGLSFRRLIAVGDSRSDILMARYAPEGVAVLVGTDPTSPEIARPPPDEAVATLDDVGVLLEALHEKDAR